MLRSLLNIVGSLILIVSLLLPGTLEFVHEHESEVECSEVHVGDVDHCHLAIHHHGEVEACEDHSHLIEHHHDCVLCDTLLGQIWLFKPHSDQTDRGNFAKESLETNYFCGSSSSSLRLDEVLGPPRV